MTVSIVNIGPESVVALVKEQTHARVPLKPVAQFSGAITYELPSMGIKIMLKSDGTWSANLAIEAKRQE